MQTYLKVLNFQNACQVYSASSVCLRLSLLSQLSFMPHVGLCVFSLTISLMLIVNRKHDPFTIVQGLVMKQWYALYVFFYILLFNRITVRDQFIELTQNNSNLSKWYLSYTMLNILQLLSMETIAVDFQMNMSTWQLVVVIWPASLH